MKPSLSDAARQGCADRIGIAKLAKLAFEWTFVRSFDLAGVDGKITGMSASVAKQRLEEEFMRTFDIGFGRRHQSAMADVARRVGDLPCFFGPRLS
jgi:hypothetical protein